MKSNYKEQEKKFYKSYQIQKKERINEVNR